LRPARKYLEDDQIKEDEMGEIRSEYRILAEKPE
jgi:hypothetical protein